MKQLVWYDGGVMIAILATCTVLIGLAVLYDIVRDPEGPTHVPLWASRNAARSGRGTRGCRNHSGTRAGNGPHGQERFRPRAGGPTRRNERRGMIEKPGPLERIGVGEASAAAADQPADRPTSQPADRPTSQPADRPADCVAPGCGWPTCWDAAPREGCAVLTNSTGFAVQDPN
jgi:hypothetical protein